LPITELRSLSNKELVGPYFAGDAGLPFGSVGVFMTASEANRQRVLTLLLVERAQTCAEFKKFYKEEPAARLAPFDDNGRPSYIAPGIIHLRAFW
jgi:hypothetical protein